LPQKKRRNRASAAKALRASRSKRARNLAVRSEIRSSVAKAGVAIAAGDPQIAAALTRKSSRLLDRAVSKGVIHERAAARRKSRLARSLGRIRRSPLPEAEEAG